MGQAMRNWWFGVRMAGLALAAVFLGPSLLVAYGRSLDAFVPAVFIANGIFWTWMLWPRRRTQD